MPALLALFSTASYAQTTQDTLKRPTENRPVIDERTKQDIREGVNKVEQNAKEAAGDVKQGVSNAAKEVKEETKEAVQDVKQGVNKAAQEVKEGTKNTVQEVKEATQDVKQEVKTDVKDAAQEVKEGAKNAAQEVKQGASNAAQEVKGNVKQATAKVDQEVIALQRNQLSWFQPGSFWVGASLGFGLGKGSGTYLNFHPRLGYFFLPGLMAGLRYGVEKRLSTSYRANQFGGFVRYYPLQGNFSAFGGVGYNVGREYASNINEGDKARYNSINLELGVMFKLLQNLGGELSLENNYYDQANPLAGRNRGGRIRFGFNYYFSRSNP